MRKRRMLFFLEISFYNVAFWSLIYYNLKQNFHESKYFSQTFWKTLILGIYTTVDLIFFTLFFSLGLRRETNTVGDEHSMRRMMWITSMSVTWDSTRRLNASMASTRQRSNRIWREEQLYSDKTKQLQIFSNTNGLEGRSLLNVCRFSMVIFRQTSFIINISKEVKSVLSVVVNHLLEFTWQGPPCVVWTAAWTPLERLITQTATIVTDGNGWKTGKYDTVSGTCDTGSVSLFYDRWITPGPNFTKHCDWSNIMARQCTFQRSATYW